MGDTPCEYDILIADQLAALLARYVTGFDSQQRRNCLLTSLWSEVEILQYWYQCRLSVPIPLSGFGTSTSLGADITSIILIPVSGVAINTVTEYWNSTRIHRIKNM